MNDTPDKNSPNSGDDTPSTADYFERRQELEEQAAEEKRALEAAEKEARKLDDLCDEVGELINDRKKRNSMDEWEDIFNKQKRSGLRGSRQFEDRIHKELLIAFGYDPDAGELNDKIQKMDNPPIRSKVIRYIFKKLDWADVKSDRLVPRQRLWLLYRSGAIRRSYAKKKRPRKKTAKSNSGCFWIIVVIAILIIVF